MAVARSRLYSHPVNYHRSQLGFFGGQDKPE